MTKRYYRKITELFPKLSGKARKEYRKKVHPRKIAGELLKLLSLILVVSGSCFFLLLVVLYQDFQHTKQVRDQVMSNYNYWQDVTRKHPNYPLGYYKAGVYALQLNNGKKAAEYLKKAVYLDPEFIEARVLLEKVER